MNLGDHHLLIMNEIIITEKSGKIKIVNIISKKITEVKHNLNFLEVGQGGLLDIIYQDNILWISYSENRGEFENKYINCKSTIKQTRIKF